MAKRNVGIDKSISHLRKNNPKMLKHIKEGVPKLTDVALVEQKNAGIKMRRKVKHAESGDLLTAFHIWNLVIELVKKEQAKRKKSIGKTETPKKSIGIKRKM